ncbi:WXG100 family type VII secretion target [Paenibacillus sp. GCM10028914]|uniref:WXG100 family type VII secretion target n=1 Tax=Paenibacillus sp. GCM10028914 TaxID=3273416 RepID=UPI00360E6C6C
MRISVEPELLRALSRQFQQSSEQFLTITNQLNQAISSLVWETSMKAAVIDEWQSAQKLGEHLGALLSQMGKHLQTKADQFQEVDHQYRTILEHAMIGGVSPTALFAASKHEGVNSILPESGTSGSVISNPSSAAAAVGMSSEDGISSVKEAALNGQGWTFTDPSSLSIAN